jgi:hypothetical protein
VIDGFIIPWSEKVMSFDSTLKETDVYRIAAALSGASHGSFSVDSIVSYGQTAILKPGASSDDGRVFTGAEVQQLLGSDYHVFPLAVEYSPSVPAILESFGEAGEDLSEIESELESMEDPDDDADEFGARPRRVAKLEKAYLKALAKFAKCQTLLQAGRGRTTFARKMLTVAMPFTWFIGNSKDRRLQNRAKKCDRLYRRLIKVRQTMERKNIDVSRLPRPEAFMMDFANRWERRRMHAVRPQARPLARPSYPRLPPAPGPRPGGYTPVSQELQREIYLRDQAALEREMSAAMPSYYGDDEEIVDIGAVIEEELGEAVEDVSADDSLAADLRAETIGYLHSDLEHDYFGLSGSDLEDMFSVDRLLSAQIKISDPDELEELDELEESEDDDIVSALAADDEAEFGVDEDEEIGEDDDLIEEVSRGDSDDEDDVDVDDSDLLLDDDGDDEDDGSWLPEKISSGLAAVRAGLFRKISDSMSSGDDEEKVGSLVRKMDAVTKKLQKASDGVDYSRVQPKMSDSSSPPVVLIAIQKRDTSAPIKQEIRGAVESVGGVYSEDSGLIDVFGAKLFEVKHGYTPAQSFAALRDTMSTSDWVRGSTGRFPNGDEAPLPPPRRIGEEV